MRKSGDIVNVRSFELFIIQMFFIVLLLLFSILLFTEASGESKALLSVDSNNEERVVRPGGTVIHNIQVENDLGSRELIVNLSANIVSVSMGGNAPNWSMQFKYNGSNITNISVATGETKIVGVEVIAPSPFTDYLIHEMVTICVTGEDGYPPVSGHMNTTRCYQDGNYVSARYLTLETTIGQNYELEIGVATEAEQTKDVNPLTATQFKLKIMNIGFKNDSYRITYNYGTPIYGESSADDSWKIVISTNSSIQDIESMNYTYIYVNVTSPIDETYGRYPFEITAASLSSYEEDTITIKAVVAIPDLEIVGLSVSPSPALDSVESIELRADVINNMGGAVTGDVEVKFFYST